TESPGPSLSKSGPSKKCSLNQSMTISQSNPVVPNFLATRTRSVTSTRSSPSTSGFATGTYPWISSKAWYNPSASSDIPSYRMNPLPNRKDGKISDQNPTFLRYTVNSS